MPNPSIIHSNLDTGIHTTIVQFVANVARLCDAWRSAREGAALSILDAQARFAKILLIPSTRLPAGNNFPLSGKSLPGLIHLLPVASSAACLPVAASDVNNHACSGKPKPVDQPSWIACLTLAFLEL